MTDKEIDVWLNRISEKGYFLLIKEISKTLTIDQQAEISSQTIDINYLEKDLGLVISLIEQNQSGHIVKLSKKGIEAINKGGWIKYKKNQNKTKRIERFKKEASYWFNIITPLAALYIAYLAIKSDNHKIEEDILNEVKELQKQQEVRLLNTLESQSKNKETDSLKTE